MKNYKIFKIIGAICSLLAAALSMFIFFDEKNNQFLFIGIVALFLGVWLLIDIVRKK
jgi:uncharacterized membrane protein